MYNSGNSSKNVTGASVVDGTLYTVDIADDAVTADKLANSVNTDIATGVSASTTAGDALPKAGGTMTGTIAGFESTGIDDNATSTAITIDASENVAVAGVVSTSDALKLLNTASPTTSVGSIYNRNNALTFRGDTSGYNFNNAANTINLLQISDAGNVVIGNGGSELTVKTGLVHVDGSASSNLASVALTRTDASWRIANETNWRLYGNTGDTTAPATNRLEVSTTGDVTVKTGNLVIGTSGKGIDFSAATPDGTGSTGSEVLDDYEEGTWTPTITSVTGTSPTIVYASQDGTYTKVGNLVTITANIYITTFTAGTNGVAKINGLPFAKGSGQESAGSIVANNISFGRSPHYGLTLVTTTSLGFLSSVNGGGWNWEPVGIFTTGSNIRISFSYFT
jgi:hypothetical protein